MEISYSFFLNNIVFCISVDPEPDSDPSKLQNKTMPITSINTKSGHPIPPPIPPRTNQSHHVTTTYITQESFVVCTTFQFWPLSTWKKSAQQSLTQRSQP